jgi:integrase
MPPFRRITGPATRQRIRATLRAALNTAITRQLITHNCAEHLEMDAAKRPKAQLWTPDRVEHWRRTGEKPSPVMVWTPDQLGVFFDQAEEHRLFALYWLIAMRGPRRGEAIGLNWPDVDLDGAQLTYVTELVQDGWDVVETAPKTDGSAATIGLGPATVEVLRAHRARQLSEQQAAGEDWADTGKVFTTELGEWLHPEFVSDEFQRLYEAGGLPSINLRDLRHVAATLIHAGGGDLHAIKEVLRHSTITLTSDTYTSLLPEVDREIAAKSEAIVPRARRPAPEGVDVGGGG